MEILAAIDEHRSSADVLDTARQMARLLPDHVEAVTAYEEGVTEAAARAARAGVPLRLLFGDPAAAIVRALTDEEVTLAVIGAGAGIGHVTRAVITRSPKGLVVVPRPLLPSPGTRAFTVVAPLDGSEATAEALSTRLAPLVDRGAEVIGLHVFTAADAPLYWDHFGYDYLAWYEGFRRSCPVPCRRLEMGRGPVATAAVGLAVRAQASLIAVAWNQDLSGGHGGVVTDLLLRSPVPLFLVPADTRARPAGLLAASSA